MTWVPGAAPSTSDGSASDGIVASMIGCSDGRPYLAASCARSIASIPGAIRIRPRISRVSSPAAVKRGSPLSTRLTLATVPGVRMLPARQSRLGPIATGSASCVRVRFGSMPATTARAVELLARRQRDAGRAAAARGDGDDLGTGPDLDTGLARGRFERGHERAWAASREDRLTGRSAVVAGGIGEQDRGRSRGPRPHRGVLDATPGDRRLDRVALEGLGHEVRDGHRQDAGDRPAVVAPEAAERPPETKPGQRVAETRRVDVGWRPAGELAEEAGQRADQPVERRVAIGVGRGP